MGCLIKYRSKLFLWEIDFMAKSNIKNWGKDGDIKKKWIEVGILTLGQLIDDTCFSP